MQGEDVVVLDPDVVHPDVITVDDAGTESAARLEGGVEVLSVEDELASESATEPGEDATIIDMASQALMARAGVTLADAKGEWVKSKGDKPPPPPSGADGDLYASFVRQAKALPRLSEEEERALGKKALAGDARAAKKLVLHNMRLGIKMAHQYRRAWTNLMDLVQEALAGMSTAAQKWDPDKGTRFGTYAAYWIRAQLTKFLMTNGRVIHTGNTRAGRKLYFNLPQIRRRLAAAGQEATIDAIAEEVGEDPKEVALIVSRLDGREASLSAPIGDADGGMTLGDAIAAEEPDPEIRAGQLELNRMMSELIDGFGGGLTEERDIAIWREHLITNDPVSLVALGKRFGVSKQRMGQLASRLKKNFRCYIIDTLGPHTQLGWLFSE